MGGKKDKKKGKNVDPEKKLALKLKKEAKAEKAARKRLAKSTSSAGVDDGAEGGDGGGSSGGVGGGDIDALLASYKSLDVASTTPVVEPLEPRGSFPYPPRANFTLTSSGGGDVYLFGGERYDGIENVTFDELYRWDPDARGTEEEEEGGDGKPAATGGQWKRIRSPPPFPPPRCSHSAIVHSDGLYIFGGELAGSDQFHHYRDHWRFDFQTNLWREIPPSGTPPTPRSGHRVVLWRHYVVLFGGFHESSSKEPKWHDDLYLFDLRTERWDKPEYSKLATTPEPRSAFNFAVRPGTDAAYLFGGYSKLKNRPPSDPGGSGSRSSRAEGKTHSDCWRLNLKPYLNNRPPTWERIKKRGNCPSPRSGTSCSVHKHRMLVYGGVIDEEMDHHAVRSVFYDDLYVFDMEKERFSKWDVRERKKKTSSAAGGRRRRKKRDGGDGNGGDAEGNEEAKADDGGGKGGASEDDEEEEEEEEEEAVEGDNDVEADGGDSNRGGWDLDRLKSDAIAFVAVDDGEGRSAPRETIEETAHEEEQEGDAKISSTAKEEKEEEAPEPSAPQRRPTPLPRINASIVVRNSVLHLYGGLLEIGDREVTLDDCWKLDLTKRDKGWICVNEGTMNRQVWRGGDDDDESRASAASAERAFASLGDADDRDEDEDESDDGGEGEADGTAMEETEEERKLRKAAAKKERKAAREKARNDEILALEATIDADGPERSPRVGETMADFYARTSESWNALAAAEVAKSGRDDDGENEKEGPSSSAKETKREAFNLAKARYDELIPALERLSELNSRTARGGEDDDGKRERKEKKKEKKRRERRNR